MSIRTAFAPIPKNNRSGRNNPPKAYNINMSFMREFNAVRVDPNLQLVMTHTSSNISMTVTAQGNTEVRLTDTNGKTVADSADIKKVIQMNTFINGERKATLKAENSQVFKNFLFALNNQAVRDNKGKPLEDLTVPVGFHDVFRTVKAALTIFDQNVSALEALTDLSEEDKVALKYIKVLHRRSRNAGAEFLLTKFKNYEDETKFSDVLFKKHVPAYCFQRLAKDKLSVNSPGFGPWKIFYPKDPSKGFCLTYKEMANTSFFHDQGDMINGALIMKEFVCNTEFISMFCNIYSEDSSEIAKIFESFSNVPMQIPIPPKFYDIEECASYAAKAGGRFPGWSPATSVAPKENLRYLGTVFKRLQYFAFPYANKRAKIFESYTPGAFTFDKADRTDLLSQFAKHLESEEDLESYPRLSAWCDTESYKLVSAEWCTDILATMLGVSPFEEDHYTSIKTMVGTAEMKTPTQTKTRTAYRDVEKEITETDADGKVQTKTVNQVEEYQEEFKSKIYPENADSIVKLGGPIPAQPKVRDNSLKVDSIDTYQPIVMEAQSFGRGNPLVEEFVKSTYDGVDRKKKRREVLLQNVRSGIHPETRMLLARIKKRNAELEKPMLDWFRTFLNPEVQAAVAKVLLVHFDFAFESSISYDTSDWAAVGILPIYEQDDDGIKASLGDDHEDDDDDGNGINADDEY